MSSRLLFVYRAVVYTKGGDFDVPGAGTFTKYAKCNVFQIPCHASNIPISVAHQFPAFLLDRGQRGPVVE